MGEFVKASRADSKKVRVPLKGGGTVTRWEVRWRAYRADGSDVARRARFERSLEADALCDRLRDATASRNGWQLSDDGWPEIAEAQPVGGPTLWQLCHEYIEANWRSWSPNGRKSAVTVIRAIAATVTDDAGELPFGAQAYLSEVAFRSAIGPKGPAEMPETVTWKRATYDRPELAFGRAWLDQSSLPAALWSKQQVQRLVVAFGDGNKASTEERRWAALRSFIRWAFENDYLPVDLRVGIVVRSTADSGDDGQFDAERTPTVDDMWAMAEACAAVDERWRALPLVLGGAGLRIGEAAMLQRRHISEDEPTGGMWIKVERTYSPVKGYATEAEMVRGTKRKGATGNLRGRTTFLPPQEAAVLRSHLAGHVDAGMDSLVFPGPSGGLLRTDWLQKAVWSSARQSVFPAPHRLENVGRHDFRHLACTRWLRAGVPFKTAQSWSGHRTLSVFLDVYQSALPDDAASGAAMMAAV